MGCCISNKFNESVYEKPKQKNSKTKGSESPVSAGSKRTYRSRRSSKSSGIYSHCSSPSPSIGQSSPNEKPKANDRAINLSYGYHSENFDELSLSIRSKSKIESAELCLTPDTSPYLTVITPPSYSTYGMELFMMTTSKNVMTNISTPIVRRKNESYTLNASAAELPTPTKNYLEWQSKLSQRPKSMLHDVSHIPEALSGNSCPLYFPAYTYNHTVAITSPVFAKTNATYILSTEL